MDNFETATHTGEFDAPLDTEFFQEVEAVDFMYNLKTQFRFFRKKLSVILRKRLRNDCKQVLIVTTQKLPKDYILAFKKQYPNKEIKVLIPIHSVENLEKTSINFEFFLQNKVNEARLYKLPRNEDNIETFGLFSAAYAMKDLSQFQYLALFLKAVRICVEKIKPDIVHADRVPFFLGAEFEAKKSYIVKVVQVVEDFSKFENDKIEAFWAAINLADKKGMKKLCRDKVIQKCIATLFNLHNTKRFTQMHECLDFLYENYTKFRSCVNTEEEIDENILFNRMNLRALQLFPELKCENNSFYNAIYFTIKKTDFWLTVSKSYYDEIFDKKFLGENLVKRLEKTKNKSDYVLFGFDKKKANLYQQFNADNFRELRARNKTYLLREFSEERIRTKFVDTSLFKTENYVVKGYLDAFYSAPLIFAHFSDDMFNQGVDIALDVILKLFELRKNVQVIINIPNGLGNNFVKSFVEFLTKNSALNGRWLYINDEIKLEQFYAASDIILLPKRLNVIDTEHFKAMKYGCIPIVSRIGVYNDTVVDIFDDMIAGCGFKTPVILLGEAGANAIYLETLTRALNLLVQNPSSWNLVIKNAMNHDSSWNFEIIEKYNEIYDWL